MRPILHVLFLALPAALVTLSAASSPAENLLAEGRVDEAIVSLQNRTQAAPNDAESYNLLCRAYFAMGDWDHGITNCEKATSLDPGNGRYHLWLGRAYGEKADSSRFFTAASLAGKVRTEFETAVRLSPDNAEARADLAEFYSDAPGIVGGGRDKAELQAQALEKIERSLRLIGIAPESFERREGSKHRHGLLKDKTTTAPHEERPEHAPCAVRLSTRSTCDCACTHTRDFMPDQYISWPKAVPSGSR